MPLPRQTPSFVSTLVVICGCAIVLTSCASSPRFLSKRSGEPKAISRKSPAPAKTQQSFEGVASYYASDFDGKKTANGEIYNMHDLTAAHRSFPFGTKVKVTNLENGKNVIVRVNDRGPFKLERIMDLSLGAAEALDMITTGTAKVRLEVVEWSDPNN